MVELSELRRRDEALARDLAGVGGGRVGRTGRETMRISREAFFNAIEVNGGTRGGKTVWDDPGFVADMKRKHPHIVVDQQGLVFGASGAGATPRCRFGRVKERIRFAGGKRVVEQF